MEGSRERAVAWLQKYCCSIHTGGESIVSEARLAILESATTTSTSLSMPNSLASILRASRWLDNSSNTKAKPNTSRQEAVAASENNGSRCITRILEMLKAVAELFPRDFVRVARPRHLLELLLSSVKRHQLVSIEDNPDTTSGKL